MTERYRLGLAEPLFVISRPNFRGLTERELDQLAAILRKVETRLREYDVEVAPLVAAARALPNPWWAEMRAELLHRGMDREWLDRECGCCYGAEFMLGKEPWFPALVGDVVRGVDPTPLATALPELIARTGAIYTEKLVSAIYTLMTFHPFGMPHQLRIENFGELWGMRPLTRDDGAVVYGYGEEGPPKTQPWETGKVRARIGEVPADDLEEFLWIPAYEGLLSWIGEVAEVLQDRTSALVNLREDIVGPLHGDLTPREGAPASLPAIAEQLFMLNRLLLGLCEELARPRRQLIKNLGLILHCHDGRWRQPKPPKGMMLQHYLRIGTEPKLAD